MISGCAFLHCETGAKADLNTVGQELFRFRRPEDVRAADETSHVAQAGSTARLGGRQKSVYTHSSGVAAQSRELPSNGPKGRLMLLI